MILYLSKNLPPKFQRGKAHQFAQYPQPCGDLSLVLLYLFDDVVSPLFRLNSLRVSAEAEPLLFVLEKCLRSLSDHHQVLQKASANPCSSGGDRGHPLAPFLALPYIFLFLKILRKSLV
jgi:hypothetical protein